MLLIVVGGGGFSDQWLWPALVTGRKPNLAASWHHQDCAESIAALISGIFLVYFFSTLGGSGNLCFTMFVFRGLPVIVFPCADFFFLWFFLYKQTLSALLHQHQSTVWVSGTQQRDSRFLQGESVKLIFFFTYESIRRLDRSRMLTRRCCFVHQVCWWMTSILKSHVRSSSFLKTTCMFNVVIVNHCRPHVSGFTQYPITFTPNATHWDCVLYLQLHKLIPTVRRREFDLDQARCSGLSLWVVSPLVCLVASSPL